MTPDKVSLADALRRELSPTPTQPEGRRPRQAQALMMNPTQQKLFEHLCLYPSSYLRDLARNLDVAVPTMDWHLTKMVKAELLAKRQLGKKLIFYPIGLIEAQHVEVFALLNTPQSREIYLAIEADPGLTQKELCKAVHLYHQAVRWHTTKLEDVGLISCTQDGNYKLYRPTEMVEEIKSVGRKRRRLFKDRLLKALKADGVEPELLRSTDRDLTIQISTSKGNRTLKICVFPIETTLSPPKPLI